MPHVTGGPTGLNQILESAYTSALSQYKDKGKASAAAWATAKEKYKKNHSGKWVEKLYTDLSGLVILKQSELINSPVVKSNKFEHLVFAVSKLSELSSMSIEKQDNNSKLVWIPVDSLVENPLNRELNKDKITSMAREILRTNRVKPLVYTEVDQDGEVAFMVTDGHHRLAALKEIGVKEIPARISDSRGVDTTSKDELVELRKEIGSVDVQGFELTREDLGGPNRKKKKNPIIGLRLMGKKEFYKGTENRARRDNDAAEEVAMGKGGAGSGSWDGPGSPRFAWASSETSKNALSAANEYVKRAGLGSIEPSEPVKVDPANAKRIAEAYDNMKSDPSDPAVRRAYGALGKEVDEQFKTLPVKIEFTTGDPYQSSNNMLEDVEKNKRLKVFTGGDEHPLLGAKDSNGISLNDKFRAVHDYYGHAMFGHKFGPNGEENAWVEHSKMFSPDAQKALTTETRGQNSWFNFSSENVGKAPKDRKFAEQKVGILPDEFLPESTKSLTVKFSKGGPGSGCSGPNCGRPDSGASLSNNSVKDHFKLIRDNKFKEFDQAIHNSSTKDLVEFNASKQVGSLNPIIEQEIADRYNSLPHEKKLNVSFKEWKNSIIINKINKGGPGSGCQGSNCGRPNNRISEPRTSEMSDMVESVKETPKQRMERLRTTDNPNNPFYDRPKVNRAFTEPFHSGSHVKQFLQSNNVVIGSVDKSNLSPEKNLARQIDFESELKNKGVSYKKGSGYSSQWGNETSYIIDAPTPEDASKVKDSLTRRYKQESVINIRNGHATMEFNDGSVKHANVDKLQAGNDITDNYTVVDGQKFRINFK